jgi:hypothetical protein
MILLLKTMPKRPTTSAELSKQASTPEPMYAADETFQMQD